MKQLTQKKETLNNVLLSNKFKIIISNDFIDKIDYICNQISDVEWSGILFYSMAYSYFLLRMFPHI